MRRRRSRARPWRRRLARRPAVRRSRRLLPHWPGSRSAGPRRSRHHRHLSQPPRRAAKRATLARPTGPVHELGTDRAVSEEEAQSRRHFGLRLSVAAVVVVGLFAVLVVRLWSLQVIEGTAHTNAAAALTNAAVQTPAPRGRILARDGRTAYAADRPETVVTLDLPYAERTDPDPPTIAMEQRLAALVPGLSLRLIESQMRSRQYFSYQPIPIAGIPPDLPPVSSETVALLGQHAAEFPDMSVDTGYSTRVYPQGSVGAQTVGYVGAINAAEYEQYAKYGYSQNDPQFGQTGIEGQYERVLAGKPGERSVQVDPSGDVARTTETTPPVAGNDVVTNLDPGLEANLQSDLSAEVGRLGVRFGGAAVIDPRNGAVLALASTPTYDNNSVVSEPGKTLSSLEKAYGAPLNNYAIQGGQEPGSTFKLVTATAALNRGLISPYTPIDDPGSFTLGNETLHDSEGGSGAGYINVSEALTVSSDVFFYTLGARFFEHSGSYGTTPIQQAAQAYGLGNADGTLERTGIDLPYVGSPQVDGPKTRLVLHAVSAQDKSAFIYPSSYYEGDAVQTAFGQGYTLETPLTMANAYATFANHGTRYAPEVAAAIVSPSGHLVRRIAPRVLDRVSFAPSTWSAMMTGFEGAVHASNGTAAGAFAGFNFSSFDIAGKTGTATYASGPPTGWFIGFGGPAGAPARYVVAVEIYQGGFGADSAAPVARKVFDYLRQHPPKPIPLPVPSATTP